MNKTIIGVLVVCAAMCPCRVTAQMVMTLQQLYEKAERESKIISVDKIGLDAANEAVEVAKGEMLPKVNASLSVSYIGSALLMSRGFSTSGQTDVIVPGFGPQKVDNGFQDNPHWGNMFSLQAMQVIYTGGALTAGIRMAELSKELAVLDISKSRQEVRLMLTGFYLDLCKMRNLIEVIDRNIGQTKKVIENMEARKRQGMVLQREITRYELQLKNMELSRVKLEDAMQIINHQLVTTLHLPEQTEVVPDMGMLDDDYMSLQELASHEVWKSAALDNNVGVRKTELLAEMEEQKLRTVRAERLPAVALVVEDNFFGPYTSDLIPVNANVNSWFVGVGVKYNLSSLWTNRHKMNKAKFNLMQSQERAELAKEGVDNEVNAAYVNLLTAFKEEQTMRKQVELAQQNYSVVFKRYQNGLSLLTDMLDASSMTLAADMDLVNARLAMLYAYYKLKYATNTL